MSLFRFNTSIAGAALPTELPIAHPLLAGDRLSIHLLSESGVPGANAQRPTLVFVAADSENILNRSPDPGLTAPISPFRRWQGQPFWQVDADGACPFVAPVDGSAYLRGTVAGIWTYDVQVLRGPDRDALGEVQAPPLGVDMGDPESVYAWTAGLTAGRRSVLRPRRYSLTVVEAQTTFLVSDLPLGCVAVEILSDGLPVQIDRTFGATTRTQLVASGDRVSLANCAQFVVRSAGVVSLVFEVWA